MLNRSYSTLFPSLSTIPPRTLKLASLFSPSPFDIRYARQATVHWRTTNFKAEKTSDRPLFSIRFRSNKDNFP